MKGDHKTLITRKEAARLLNVTTSMVDIYRMKREIKAVPTAENRIYFLKGDIEAYKKRRDDLKAMKSSSKLEEAVT